MSIALASISYFRAFAVLTVLSYLAIIIGISLVIMYSVVCYKTVNRHTVNISNNERIQRRRQQADTEVSLYSFVVTIIFIICNFPASIEVLFKYPNEPTFVSEVLLSLNPFLDTLLYFAWNYCKRRRDATVRQTPPAEQPQVRNNESAAYSTARL